MKDSTKMLCRQLQKKPAVEGNQQQVRLHKRELVKKGRDVIEEMEKDLTFAAFVQEIDAQIAESDRYDKLKEQERQLTNDIQETTAQYKRL